MNILLFTDLDDTLFTSARKAPPQAGYQSAALLKDGRTVSYASPVQQRWFAHWQRHATIIPVTARNLDAYRRVQLPFCAHAVLDYGGIILNPDGQPDPDWRERSAACARESRPALQHYAQSLAGLRPDLNIRIIEDFDIPFYLLVKSTADIPLDDIAAHLAALREQHETLHHNGNNLALLPTWLDKAHAVAHLREHYRRHHGEHLALGMGDSHIDTAFMRQCDYLITPNDSQITHKL